MRDLPELLITRLAFDRQIPMLGICRGVQTLAMALGGRVHQDISHDPTNYRHSQDADRSEPTHTVEIEKGSVLYNIYNKEKLFVNSFHHQAVAAPGERFKITARALDGVVEAIESSEHKAVLGVQWHPEWLGDDGFDHRDPKVLYDLHKMNEGRTDAVTMVAYLPQPKPEETFADVAPFPVDTPKAYADLIFDKIDEIVLSDSRYIALARSREDLLRNKRNGVKSLMIGIENGLAIENDLQNVKHFADRGIVYITLCHNGDNQICDSARRTLNTHGGVSAFGAEVIREMNRLGVMVDMSHAGEKSFYDALEISAKPICSHSNSKALCDVPRNLTDDQMRALAAKDGVCQITLYNGFLRTDGKACINDAMLHLEHAINVMGIDHVGLGTDFDGDGGVPGLADASELINFTKELLRRRYSEEDMAKIWGGNWLRALEANRKL